VAGPFPLKPLASIDDVLTFEMIEDTAAGAGWAPGAERRSNAAMAGTEGWSWNKVDAYLRLGWIKTIVSLLI
jgi:hypothetical protein